MTWFLVKSDPEEFSCEDLKKAGDTLWDGVHSRPAILVIRQMSVGDYVLIYHSLTTKDIVGLGRVVSEPFLNEADPRYSWAMRIEYVEMFKQPVSLASIKAEPIMADFGLVRQSRLSVMKLEDKHLTWLQSQIPELTKY